jgi:hypothetical protein
MTNVPQLRDRVQKCVKPRKSKVSLSLSPRHTLLGCLATEADQPGFVRVQGQFERAQPLMQVVQKGLCLMLVLEADDGVVGIANDDYVAVRLGVAPSLDPQIVRVVQVDVGSGAPT